MTRTRSSYAKPLVVKIVSAPFLVVGAIPQQIVGDHENRMGDGYSRSFGTTPPRQPAVLCAQVVIGPTLGMKPLEQGLL